MNTSLSIAAVGLRAYQQKLDSISNNIANVDTTGYKTRDASFSENLATSIMNQPNPQSEVGRSTPLGIRTTYGTHIGLTQLDLSQGSAKQTDNPYDLMIEGNGFFQVQRGSGNTRQIMYTRSGAFHLSPVGGTTSQLVNGDGDVLLDRTGNPILLNNTTDVQVAPNGTIAGSNQQIGIMQISNPQLLTGEGGVFSLTGNGTATLDPNSQVKQGFLENSNVDMNQEMTDLIKVQRGYQANARALSYADQMMGISNSIYRG